MPTEQLLLTVMTGVIALLGLVVSFATWLSKTKADSGKQDAHNAVVITKLDSISDNVREIKERQTSLEIRIGEVDKKATHACERADAAHNRMDRAGIDRHE